LPEIVIKDYQILTPVQISVSIDGKDVLVPGKLDYANRYLSISDDFKGLGIEKKFFEYLHDVISLPANFFAVSRPEVPKPEGELYG